MSEDYWYFLVVGLRYGLAAAVAPKRGLAAFSSSAMALPLRSSSALPVIRLDHHIHHRISQTDH
jgi:hypothetical protein